MEEITKELINLMLSGQTKTTIGEVEIDLPVLKRGTKKEKLREATKLAKELTDLLN